jgi:hypothetical protein
VTEIRQLLAGDATPDTHSQTHTSANKFHSEFACKKSSLPFSITHLSSREWKLLLRSIHGLSAFVQFAFDLVILISQIHIARGNSIIIAMMMMTVNLQFMWNRLDGFGWCQCHGLVYSQIQSHPRATSEESHHSVATNNE